MLESIKKIIAVASILLLFTIVFPHHALAVVPSEGQYIAADNCEAVVSIKKGTNPDNARLTKGQTYAIVGQNSETAPSHYLLEVAGAVPSQRWVATSCFNTAANITASVSKAPIIPVTTGKDYLLAVSWQPAFCEGKPDKPECENLAKNPTRPEASNFVLHGLWPQPKSNVFCGVSKADIALDEGPGKDWSKLPAIEKELSPQTWQRLQAVMPGTISYLHRHEWIKHGTCYQGTPEEYYTEAIALLDAVNKSPVQALVASNIGRQVTIQDIDQALSAFSATAGDKVEVKCSNSLLGELWLNLEGNISADTPIATLLANSPNAKPEKYPSCLIDDARD
jgi:ribonuclease T2